MNNKNFSQKEFSLHIKKLKLSTRNKVRSIISSDEDQAIKILNKLRKSSTPSELDQITKTILIAGNSEFKLPATFPDEPQTAENYRRLYTFSLEKQLANLDYLINRNIESLESFFEKLLELNTNIADENFVEADENIYDLHNKLRYSHLLLRKSIERISVV